MISFSAGLKNVMRGSRTNASSVSMMILPHLPSNAKRISCNIRNISPEEKEKKTT
jgi:hypothetical protein